MRRSIIIVGLLFFISTIKAKTVTYIDKFFEEYPIESSTAKNFFKVPAYSDGCETFAFKVYKPHPEFKFEFTFVIFGEEPTNEDIVNTEEWKSKRDYSSFYKGDEYDYYYIYTNFLPEDKFLGVFFTTNEEFKVTLEIRPMAHVFPLSTIKETIINDYEGGYHFKAILNGDEDSHLSLVIKAYKPLDITDFRITFSQWKVQNQTDYEIRRTWPDKKDLKDFRVKETSEYILFSYPFFYSSDIKSLTFYITSGMHYKLGFYLTQDS